MHVLEVRADYLVRQLGAQVDSMCVCVCVCVYICICSTDYLVRQLGALVVSLLALLVQKYKY